MTWTNEASNAGRAEADNSHLEDVLPILEDGLEDVPDNLLE